MHADGSEFMRPAREREAVRPLKCRVSVLVTAYNHVRFITQAVESTVGQRTDFAYEVVIGEDCSTDGTREILLSLRHKYPDKIRLLLRQRNLGNVANLAETLGSCRGEYVALLDGDDYWTSPAKLQRQVDFLDSHPEFSSCAHDVLIVDESGRIVVDGEPRRRSHVIDLPRMLSSDSVRTASVMFRRGLFAELPSWYRTVLVGDWPLHVLNLRHGNMWYDAHVFAAYRIHSGGLWSSAAFVSRRLARIDVYHRLNAELGFAHDRLIRRRIARQYLALAEHYAREHDVARMRESVRQAVQTGGWNPHLLLHRAFLRLVPPLLKARTVR